MRKVVIAGTRGVPARYGGFETFAEELGVRLVDQGFSVTVYGRRGFGDSAKGAVVYRGMQTLAMPTVRQKYLDTPVASLFSLLHAVVTRADAVILCNAANSPFAWIPRLFRIPVFINVDGVERKRQKWSLLGRLWYRLGEYCSVLFASRVVADAEVIARYYRDTHHCPAVIIPYGASARNEPAGETLAKLGVTPGQYLLYVSRLEPENNALGVIDAYEKSGLEIPLVIVGDAPYAAEYKKKLRERASERVVFAGFKFEGAYWELRNHCLLYVQATEVGGTHPALVEAMAAGNCVLANDVPEHREVLGDSGLYYPRNDFESLAALFQRAVQDKALREKLGKSAAARAEKLFSWEAVTRAYTQLIKGEVVTTDLT